MRTPLCCAIIAQTYFNQRKGLINAGWRIEFQLGQKATKMDRLTQLRQQILDGSEVDNVTLCWIWKGGCSGKGRGGGYGRMSLCGQTVATHRVSYTLWHGYIPSKKQVDHKCRNRKCCNPEHLELVSHKENQKRRDKARDLLQRQNILCE